MVEEIEMIPKFGVKLDMRREREGDDLLSVIDW